MHFTAISTGKQTFPIRKLEKCPDLLNWDMSVEV